MFKIPETLFLQESAGSFKIKPDHPLSDLAATVEIDEPLFSCSIQYSESTIEVPNIPSAGWKLVGFHTSAIFRAPLCYQNKLIVFPLSSLNILSGIESLETEELTVVLDSQGGFKLLKSASLNNPKISAMQASDNAFLASAIKEEHHGLVVHTQIGKTKHYGIIQDDKIVGLKNPGIVSTFRLWEPTDVKFSDEITHQICQPIVGSHEAIKLVEVDYLSLKGMSLLNASTLPHVCRFKSLCIPLVPAGSCAANLPPLQHRSVIPAVHIESNRSTNLYVVDPKLSVSEFSLVAQGSSGVMLVENYDPSLSFTPKNLSPQPDKPKILGFSRRLFIGITPMICLKTVRNKIEISLEAHIKGFSGGYQEVCWKKSVSTGEEALIVLEALIRINEPLRCVAAHLSDVEPTETNLFIWST